MFSDGFGGVLIIPPAIVWPFALGLVLWTVLLLWVWVQVGRSLDAPVQREDESQDPSMAG